jgi:LuxR family transcriptional regulator, maltose regulon positive regulatory protein
MVDRVLSELADARDGITAEYLLAELLDRQPPDVRQLLLRTSLLDRVNGKLAVC